MTEDGMREALAEEVARHGDTMSQPWEADWDADVIRLGCRCGHERAIVSKADLAANLSDHVHGWRLHAADALLPILRRIAAAELRDAADALDDQARACSDEYDERGFSAYTWAAEVVRARAAALDPEQVR